MLKYKTNITKILGENTIIKIKIFLFTSRTPQIVIHSVS
jgi:hypothetical protein